MDILWPEGERIPLPCPVCGTPGPHPVLLRAGAPAHTLIRCTACTACFFQEMTQPDYASQAGPEVFQQMYLEQNAGIHHMTGVLFRLDDPGIDSVLDVGCGFGYPVDLAAKVLGWRACGVDPAHYAQAGARLLGADLRQEYLTGTSELGEPFSLVMGSEVIEHISEPYPFMALLRRWMKPDGTLVLMTPDAAMLTPGQDAATMFCMLSVGLHMVLYTAQAMEAMLRRAGFAHVRVERDGNSLIAFAAGHPLRFHPDAAARHLQGYRAYLQHLVGTAEPGSPLWNGAAGRLFAHDCHGAPLHDALAQWERIAAAWRARGIDLARRRLPPPVAELRFGQDPLALLMAQAATQPFNLGGVLHSRAVLERRIPGSIPEGVLAYARPAFRVSVEARRVLEECGLIDLDLHHHAWQARLLMLDCLVELAPELEAELLAALAAPSAPGLAQRIDVPPGRLLPRLAPPFMRLVGEGRYAEAARLEPFLQDLDAVCDAPYPDPPTLLRMLYQVGILRLNYRRDLPAARAAFERMAEHASGWFPQPAWTEAVRPLLDLATAHVALVDRMGAPPAAAPVLDGASQDAPADPAPAAKQAKPKAQARRRRVAAAAG